VYKPQFFTFIYDNVTSTFMHAPIRSVHRTAIEASSLYFWLTETIAYYV